MSKTTKIKPLDGFSNVSDPDVVKNGTAVQTSMTGNSNFPNPPVDLVALKTAIDTFSALMAQALDGSKKVIAEKNKQREAVIKMLRLLGRYVEVTCKDDMAIFLTSGFQPAATKTATAPLSEKIRKIGHGANSGQIVVWIRSIPKASSYELRYAPAVNGATPGTWTTQGVAMVKAPVIVTGLLPGSTYVFQARALAKDGYTDWSDSVTFICT
ncbi:MAG TPA: fibronectin type III domain-containing protein [Terriglobia bacterium]|nr:fibronectin type III domain-containing protein [Terriglobia bacterium]